MSTRKLSRRDFLRMSALSAGAAALAMTNSTVSAATPPQATKGGTLRVYWNPGHHYETYKAFADSYEKETGWKTSWEIYQWPDMRTKLLANFAAGDVPDISEEAGSWSVEFGIAGNVLPLTAYIQKYGKEMGFPDDWQPAALKAYKWKDEYYGIKLHHTCQLLFYNMEIFDKAGVKAEKVTTWEEFLAACQATAKGNVFGFAPNQSNGYAWPWFYQNGVLQYDAVKNVVPMDNEAAYEALQYQADLIHKHKVAPIPVTSADYEGPQKLFSAKRAAIILTGPWDVKPILTASPDVKWGMIQPLKRKAQATVGAGAGMFIPKKAKNADAAFDWMRRITSLEIEKKATVEANMLMPRLSWAADKEVLALERIAPFAQALNVVVDNSEITLTGKSGAIADLFGKAYNDTIYKNTPASQTLKEYVVEANKLLAQK